MTQEKPLGTRIDVTNLSPAQPLLDERVLDAEDDGGTRSLGQAAPVNIYVSDTPISEAAIAKEMQYHPAALPEKSRADAARALVVRELLHREIERLGLEAELADEGGETRDEAAIGLLIEQEIERRAPTDADCAHYYAHNRERFHTPDELRVRHILLAAAGNDSEGRVQARDKAAELIEELKTQPHLFADFAQRFSDCPSKQEGGDLGWLAPGQTTPEFDRQLFRLPQGLAEFAIESRWGYHIVQVDERAAGHALDYDAAKSQISNYLELQTHQQEVQLYLQKLQFDYGVKGLDEIEAAVP